MKKVKNCVCAAALLLASGAMLFADDGNGSLFDMRMPSVDFPTLAPGLYAPGPQAGRQAGPSGGASSGPASAAVSDAGKSASVTPSSASTSLLSTLSAGDLATLGSRGLLGQFGSLFDGGEASYYSNLYTSGTNDETNSLLQKILTRLEDIKTQSDEASAPAVAGAEEAKAEAAQAAAPAPVRTVAARGDAAKSHLLRFTVNGYDVLRTCRTVYISDVQQDGTFLVTGDRRYLSDGKTRTETFHMLFKTAADSADLSTYAAATAVSQDYFNPNSFMYQLSQRQNMSASRTGNLVTMRTDDPTWRLELLIDLGEERQ